MTFEDTRRAIILIEELAEELDVMRTRYDEKSTFGASLVIMANEFLSEVTDEAY